MILQIFKNSWVSGWLEPAIMSVIFKNINEFRMEKKETIEAQKLIRYKRKSYHEWKPLVKAQAKYELYYI